MGSPIGGRNGGPFWQQVGRHAAGALVTLILALGAVWQTAFSAPPRPALPLQPPASGAIAPAAESHTVLTEGWQVYAPAPTPRPGTPVETVAAAPGVTPLLRGPKLLRWTDGAETPVYPATPQAGRWQLPDTAAGWHSDSAACGDDGATVIGAHVAYNGVPGAFQRLLALTEDARVACLAADGATRRFMPVDYLVVAPDQAVATWMPSWQPALLLYTCTPELDGQLLVVRFKESP